MHKRVSSWGLRYEDDGSKGDNNDDTGLKFKTSWQGFSQLSCLGQMIFGIILFTTSTWYLSHSGRASGQVIGGASVVLGAAGLIGAQHQKPQFQTLFIVGMGFMALLTFEFVAQMGRDVTVHCNFAESYVRIAHLEDAITSMRHDEIIEQIFARMNEMDDMMDMVSEGTMHTVEMRAGQSALKSQDQQYIESKVQALQQHADTVLDHIYERAKALQQEGAADLQEKERQKQGRAELKRHLDNLEAVAEHLQKADEEKRDLTYQEYEMLYNALKEGHPGNEAIRAEEEHLPFLSTAMDRLATDQYHEYDVTNKGERLAELANTRRERREAFETVYQQIHGQHSATAKEAFDKSLMSRLSELPEHCLAEVSHYSAMKWGGWLLMCSQLLAAYIASTSLVVTTKTD